MLKSKAFLRTSFTPSIHLSRGPKGEIRFMVRGQQQMNSCINETTTQCYGWGHISVQKLNKVGIALPSQHTDKLDQNKNLLVLSYFGKLFVSHSSQPLTTTVHVVSLPYHILKLRRFCMVYVSVSQTFFKWGPLSLIRMFQGPPYSWDYQTHQACPKQCSEHVFATKNP